MTGLTDDEADRSAEKAVIQVDLYGIKVRSPLQPAPPLQEGPDSWREVGKRVNQHLMALTEGLFGVLAEAVRGLRKVIRGASSIPESVANRIEGAHKTAIDREADRQEPLEAFICDPDLFKKTEALEKLEKKLQELRRKGLLAGITIDEEGRPVLFALKKEARGHLVEIIRKALPGEVSSRGGRDEEAD